jgi:indolepyruvate ferredoxin oxidoreductase beta subunit
MSVPAPSVRPVTLLIAALGGEGGGVLSNWIVNAAQAAGLPVQATSIPGVAQRTGSTTYYVELWPQRWGELNGKAPLLALSPAMGEVDLLAVTELLEAGRAIRNGYVSPDRTLVIASTQRVYTTTEKMAMSDGRFDPGTLRHAVEAAAQVPILLDLQGIARDAQAPVNAVLLGAMAGSGRIPITEDAFRAGIRAEGKAAEANVRGFDAGLAAARGEVVVHSSVPAKRPDPVVDPGGLMQRMVRDFPAEAHDVLGHGIRRLVDYQDAGYGELYLDRLEAFRGGDVALLATVARHLAVRMSYEDAIRVAQAKIRPERMARVREETGAAPDEPVVITEFLKPGLEEICDILPRPLAALLLALARGSPRIRNWRRGMYVRSTSILGYLQVRLLAEWRRGRRTTWRYRHEQEAIAGWLRMVHSAAGIDAGLAAEAAECARLIKGYGDTFQRGQKNYQTIVTQLVLPVLVPGRNAQADAARIAQARTAALADPEGSALAQAIRAATDSGAPNARPPMAAASD